jgi:hypothetical protein
VSSDRRDATRGTRALFARAQRRRVDDALGQVAF